MQRLLTLPDPPTAVFTHNDVLAMGAMRAIYDAGLTVPEDVSVVGYDDTISASYLNPRLTTVKIPRRRNGTPGRTNYFGIGSKRRPSITANHYAAG